MFVLYEWTELNGEIYLIFPISKMRQVADINNKQILSLIYDKNLFNHSISNFKTVDMSGKNIPSVKFNTICLCDDCCSAIGETNLM